MKSFAACGGKTLNVCTEYLPAKPGDLCGCPWQHPTGDQGQGPMLVLPHKKKRIMNDTMHDPFNWKTLL